MEKVENGRRKFLETLIGLVGLTTVGGLAFPFVRYLHFLGASKQGSKVTVKKSEITADVPKKIIVAGKPVVVIKEGKGYFAMSLVCTHLGCLVIWEKDKKEFLCPCHAGRFDIDGKPIAGPPKEPLKKYKVEDLGDELVIGA